MIAHEFFELDDIIEELRMVTDTLCALEVATTESSSIIPERRGLCRALC